ncbi:hypothetical protein PRIPAC_92511 [Pristionchus pacificus]|uniref:GrpE protein homolog n=1 Tax=Pristionchus pacificus TaxID=54126 RepID=A0A2A6BQZ0_PRIPA|nr:hypothetical protein PRIPAC_92511 [Pristionchus pacificus]|eukprot:PDM68297.1 hypothetical protein PRIPAC_46341 [Pristionchus pacificus]
MLSRTIARVGSVVGRSAEAGLLSKSSRLSVALNSTQAAESSNGSTVKFELKDAKGVRLSGDAYVNIVRERLAVKEGEEGQEWQVPHPAFDALVKEYDSLIEEGKEWKDRYTRALAETENVRRRGTKQVEDTKVFAVQGFCKDLLEVADILDLAVDSVKEEQLKTASKDMKDLYDGVKMTKTVLLKTFAKHGLQPCNPIGEQFDPNLHEAVFQVPKEQAKFEVGHIEHVMKIGYILKERPVRAAQVGVVKE